MVEATGDNIVLKTSNQKHFGVAPSQPVTGDFTSEFASMLKDGVKNVNDLQVSSDKLATQMIRKPDSVDVHDVMISAQKAQLSLEYTKALLTRAVQAYQNITNLR